MANYNPSEAGVLTLGDDLFLYLYDSGETTAATSYQVVAFATSCSIQIDGETIDTSNKMSGRWNANLGGKNGYTISSEALYTAQSGVTNFDSMMADMVAGNTAGAKKWIIGHASGSTYALDTTNYSFYEGEAFITSLSLNAGNNEVASCSITLTGSGAIVKKEKGSSPFTE